MPPRRRRRAKVEGLVEPEMIYDEYSTAPGEGYDLDNLTQPSDAEIFALACQVYGLDPAAIDTRHKLAFTLKRAIPRHRKVTSEDRRFNIIMHLAGVIDDDDPGPLQKRP